MGHGDAVKGDATTVTASIGAQVPSLDVLLLGLAQAGKLNRGDSLLSKVHSSLHHVARASTVVGAGAVAVLSKGRVSIGRIEADATSTIHGTLKLGKIVRTRKCLLGTGSAQLAHHLSVGEGEDQTWATVRSLLHDRRVAELLDKCLATLDGGVGNLGSLVRVEAGPEPTLDAVDEREHAVGIREVNEGVANVAARLEIDTKVHEVVSAKADVIEDVLKGHLLKWSALVQLAMQQATYPIELVGDVAKHDSSANVAAIKNALTTNAVVLIVGMVVVAGTMVGILIGNLMVGGEAITVDATMGIEARLGAIR